MKRPNFEPIFEKKTDFCEVSSEKPVSSFMAGQSISISELIKRFERGQRLGVHCNFRPGENFENISDDQAASQMRAEDMDSDDFPPVGVHDITDVEEHYKMHQAHKADFSARRKKKVDEAKQVIQKAQQAETTPPTPSEA